MEIVVDDGADQEQDLAEHGEYYAEGDQMVVDDEE